MTEASSMERAPRNRSVTLSSKERKSFLRQIKQIVHPVSVAEIENTIINQDLQEAIPHLPSAFVDLLFVDPPYNLTKSFNGAVFKERSRSDYQRWFESWFVPLLRTLKPSASVYICADWRSSAIVQTVAESHLIVRNRITWEREKGRGAQTNWKNCGEDIWFCTVSNSYTFNVEAVKLKRRVIAPYTDGKGNPKDWQNADGGRYRLTHPSNLWTDITVPFWSMPENTHHPAQKPEKLLAKIILASSVAGDLVFDPFLGSGTTSVTAKKLGRRYLGIEVDEDYCCLAHKRLTVAEKDKTIQGYREGVFWERNAINGQRSMPREPVERPQEPLPFS